MDSVVTKDVEEQKDIDYKRTVEDIKQVLFNASPKETNRDSDIEIDKHLKRNISKRDDDVTLLLNNFVIKHNSKTSDDKKLKQTFLRTLFAFAILIGIIIVGSIIYVILQPLHIENLISLLGIIFSFLASALLVVKMLLNYLFPLDADKNIISLISTIINHDLSQYQQLRNISEDDKNNKD